MKNINSLDNPFIKNLVKLKGANIRRKQGVIIVDGWREINSAFVGKQKILNLLYCPSLDKKTLLKDNKFFNLEMHKIIEVSERVFLKICYKQKPDGFLALVKTPESSLEDIKLTSDSLMVVLENVEKPGNLGAIIRTSSAAGVTAIIVNNNQTDVYNPNVIRASEGNVFSQKIIRASIEKTVEWLKNNKIKSFGAVTRTPKKYTDVDLKGRVAIVLGSEAQGISSEWLEKINQLINIPMLSDIDSLNVSVAGAVILYESLRQRGFKFNK
jgi:TrmH family RNA methyltransferase